MAKTQLELSTEIVVAMIENKMIVPSNNGDAWTSGIYAGEVATAFQTVFDKVSSVRG